MTRLLGGCATARRPARAGPIGNNSVPSAQCTPARPGQLIGYGLTYLQNPTRRDAVITRVSLRGDRGLALVRAWAVPTTSQIYGVGPPPPGWKVNGWRWADRQPAVGATVAPTRGRYHRLNIVLVLKIGPGRDRGTAAGVDVGYRLAGRRYLIPYKTAVTLAGHC